MDTETTPEQIAIVELAEVCKEIIRILMLVDNEALFTKRLEEAYRKASLAKNRMNT
jgi:hypothetical protein